MSLNHETTQQLLPEYINGALTPELQAQVDKHCSTCRECAGDRALLQEMITMDVPDPGEIFWQTLPKKVVSSVEPRRSWWQCIPGFLFRPAPLLALAASAVIAVVFALPQHDGRIVEQETIAAVEQVEIPRETVREVAAAVREGNSGFESPVDPDESLVQGYQTAIASLNKDELDELFEILQQEPSAEGDA